MSFFPLFIDISKLNVLVVGGGAVATEKLKKLVEFTDNITIIADEISVEVDYIIKNNSLTFYKRKYKKEDIKYFDIVVVATDTQQLHKQIYKDSRDKKILINSVDNINYCDFIFPSYVKKGDLVVSFSTGGSSPMFARYIRRYFENMIPDSVGSFLNKMKTLRSNMPKGQKRMDYFETLVKEYFQKHWHLLDK